MAGIYDSDGPTCPLCGAGGAGSFHRDKKRDYYDCGDCALIFVPTEQLLSSEDEKAQYDQHRNSPEDQGYRRFLGRVFTPMAARLTPGSRGLDFGSGPGPTLSVMFEEIGHSMTIYDHFYARDPSVLERQYDFITATEVLEHLHDPKGELERLWALLEPGGSLGVMTKLAPDRESFARWHYKVDPTHVRFFSRRTFEFLAQRWRASLTFADKDVVLLGKIDPDGLQSSAG